jgi:hypothetical protein
MEDIKKIQDLCTFSINDSECIKISKTLNILEFSTNILLIFKMKVLQILRQKNLLNQFSQQYVLL